MAMHGEEANAKVCAKVLYSTSLRPTGDRSSSLNYSCTLPFIGNYPRLNYHLSSGTQSKYRANTSLNENYAVRLAAWQDKLDCRVTMSDARIA